MKKMKWIALALFCMMLIFSGCNPNPNNPNNGVNQYDLNNRGTRNLDLNGQNRNMTPNRFNQQNDVYDRNMPGQGTPSGIRNNDVNNGVLNGDDDDVLDNDNLNNRNINR